MEYELARPPAHAMIESLRGVGYTVQTAIADILDNSISAGASNVWIDFHFEGPDSYITIRDDGSGMSGDELRQAMTLGSKNPLEQRVSGDLGRFGYGLKTASFSQCRNLTVASKKSGVVQVRRWDLDYIARPNVNEWRLLSHPEDGSVDRIGIPTETGTIVLWDRLDRLTAGMKNGDTKSRNDFYKMMDRVANHLAMVFHRFLEGPQPSLRIFINGTSGRVRAWDPFLTSHGATYQSLCESIPSPDGNRLVRLQGFVLPHKDQLDDKSSGLGAGAKGWTSQQGFYVYRNRRMLVAGSWLGLGYPRVWTSEEPYKLARLSLDFGNESDTDWDIDIKKSVARPPYWAAHRINALAETIRERARKVFAHRGQYGKNAAVIDLDSAWEITKLADGSRYRINREHPAVARAIALDASKSPIISSCLRIIEETVPVQRIWLDTVENGETQKDAFLGEPSPELIEMAQHMLNHFVQDQNLDLEIARKQMLSTEPFQNFPEVIANLTVKTD